VDVVEARAVLGVTEADGWDSVRLAYRRRIRVAHPDVGGPGSAPLAARLNEAYGVLSRARRAGMPPAGARAAPPSPGASPPRSPPPAPPASPPPAGVSVAGPDTLLLAASPDEAFSLLLEAGHRVGNVSYVDRSCAIFEVVVRHGGETCSLVVTLEGRGHGTEALLTLEALERVATLSPDGVLARLAAALG
jgi:hypothetical protein